jgi:hypothetical protein
VVPGIIDDAGEHATRRFLEFFAATIRNWNTRAACMVAVSRLFASVAIQIARSTSEIACRAPCGRAKSAICSWQPTPFSVPAR